MLSILNSERKVYDRQKDVLYFFFKQNFNLHLPCVEHRNLQHSYEFYWKKTYSF